jgi:membrane protein DedA with SNARE-associated domain
MLVASITSWIDSHGQWALLILFFLVAAESFGLPLPGETALIACGVLASHGTVSIAAVIAIAAAAAIIGDNLGYWVAREGGRPLLYRYGITRRYAERFLPRGERFFAVHGGKTVFFARFIAVLRVTAAWVAGLTRMHWWHFLIWNAAGGIAWATLVGLIAYYLGSAAADALAQYGFFVFLGGGILTIVGLLIVRWLERRVVDE